MTSSVTKVAVYGTLKRGMSNHILLERAFYLGSDFLEEITLYDLGEYPAARLEPSEGIYVEVFEISGLMLKEMDLLEGYDSGAPENGLYNRVVCQTSHGRAWIYIFNPTIVGCPRLSAGSWQPISQ